MAITVSPFMGAVIGGIAGYFLAERGDLRHVGDPTPLVGGIAGAALGGWLLPGAFNAVQSGITINNNPSLNTPSGTNAGNASTTDTSTDTSSNGNDTTSGA